MQQNLKKEVESLVFTADTHHLEARHHHTATHLLYFYRIEMLCQASVVELVATIVVFVVVVEAVVGVVGGVVSRVFGVVVSRVVGNVVVGSVVVGGVVAFLVARAQKVIDHLVVYLHVRNPGGGLKIQTIGNVT